MPLAAADPWESYRRTVVEIRQPDAGSLVVRPAPMGQVGTWPWSMPQPVHVLTAWDPGAERPGDAVNRRRQHELQAALVPLATGMWAAVGLDPVTGHREEGVAVSGISELQAVALGARFGQDAVIRWTPTEWVVVGCVGRRRAASGWSLGSR